MQTEPKVPEDVRQSVRETMSSYGNAATDGRAWNLYGAMNFAEQAVLADRATRPDAAGIAADMVLVPDRDAVAEAAKTICESLNQRSRYPEIATFLWSCLTQGALHPALWRPAAPASKADTVGEVADE